MRFYKDFRILSKSSIAVIGGTGKIGRVLIKLLKDSGGEIFICSRNLKKAEKASKALDVKAGDLSLIKTVDITIVSVPIENIIEAAVEAAAKMEKGLLIDVSSVKIGVVDKILSLIPSSLEYLSLHPLFGSRVKSFKDKNMAFIKVKEGELTNAMLEYLRWKGLNLIETSLKDHDEKMAAIQVIHHYAYICLAFALEDFASINELTNFSTTFFEKTLKQLKRLSENINVVLDIQKRNVYGFKARRKFLNVVNAFQNMSDEDVEKIVKCMAKFNKLYLK
ncbi:prephenate dehydrogenase/arogenate dehydrogenase family protein [Candidatus Bathyarchaeota archaeon]|nr:prephenate dehydrogenase/arogenate dehydrogenase family protein [Candidatus Bathyarchaeota archaeon]